MASSRVTSPPVSLKDRIAALEKKKNPNGPTSTSPPPSVSPSPARSLSPTGSTTTTNNVNNLRDKITKFEKKGGTPIPRGSFGAAVPPPDVPGAAKRVGELYGNRVPGLDRPTHAPVVGMRGTTAPLRPQMTGGDILGLRPQMTGADPSSLRPQFTGDGRFQRRTASTYEPAESSLPGDEETRSYAPFVPPTSLPSEGDEPLATTPLAIQVAPDVVDTSDGSNPSTVSEIEGSSIALEAPLGLDDPQTASIEDAEVHEQPVSRQSNTPIVETIKAPWVVKVIESALEVKTELKSQGSVETLRETPGSATGDTAIGISGVPSLREASASKRDLEVDYADRSSASIDLRDVAIVTQPQVHITSSTPRSVVVEPSPPVAQAQSRPERTTKVAQRPVTQYETPKSTPYVEPEFDTPQPATASKSTFTAVVHRRTTVQNNDRPTTTYETSLAPVVPLNNESVPAPAPRIPVQTVTSADVSFSAEDLGSLLADAALLEEALNLGPMTTPKRDAFPQVSLASTLSAVPSDTQRKHHRTGSQMTIKAALQEGSQPRVEKTEDVPSPAPVGKTSGSDEAVVHPPSSPPNVIVAEPEPASIGEFANFGFQELIIPSEMGQIPGPQVGEEIPPTPPPKSPPSSYLSSMRSSAAKRMSSLLPEGTRRSVSSSDDSAPLGTPPSQDLDVQATRSPRHSKSYNALRDDTSQKSRSTGGRDDSSFLSHESKRSKWSFKSNSKSSKGLSRASTFADRIWPGSNKKNRVASDNSVETPPEVSPLVQSPSPPKSAQPATWGAPPRLPPSPSIIEGPDSRPISWLSETSSAISSPGFDDQFFDQFPTVPGQSAARSLPSLSATTSSKSKVGQDGTLLTPPDRGSSLSHMFASSARQR